MNPDEHWICAEKVSDRANHARQSQIASVCVWATEKSTYKRRRNLSTAFLAITWQIIGIIRGTSVLQPAVVMIENSRGLVVRPGTMVEVRRSAGTIMELRSKAQRKHVIAQKLVQESACIFEWTCATTVGNICLNEANLKLYSCQICIQARLGLTYMSNSMSDSKQLCHGEMLQAGELII